MGTYGLPPAQGLYDPEREHDACGIGFIAHVKGIKSHGNVRDALTILENLNHRGGQGSEEDTGDGAGILLQIPDVFFKRVCGKELSLPEAGQYGVGMVFMPPHQETAEKCKSILESVVCEEGLGLIGWRKVPIEAKYLGKTARESMPWIMQFFVRKSEDLKVNIDFERKLYIVRRLAEKRIEYIAPEAHQYFYICSLSSQTIVYKGMLTATQLRSFYPDLSEKDLTSAIVLVHSRFSTNTFPTWSRAHPNRYLIHNGEINTLRGNINWMKARESSLMSTVFGESLQKVLPVINTEGSDSAMLDNCLELLYLSGRSLAQGIMMTIPEPWGTLTGEMDSDKRAFYEYHSCLMEPWDGPAAIAFTDGARVGAVLDRNGLRPARYYVTKEGRVILSSEVGALELPSHTIVEKGRLSPGKMLLVDTIAGEIVHDEKIKQQVAATAPYGEWIRNNLIPLKSLATVDIKRQEPLGLLERQKVFGYTTEDLRMNLLPMARDGEEPIGSMGMDTPLAVLSERPQSLFNYFKQLFAQVTNPPIDALREKIITSTVTSLGTEGNLLEAGPEGCRRIQLESPCLSNEDLEKLRNIKERGFSAITLSMLYPVAEGASGLEGSLKRLFSQAEGAIDEGQNLIILSDRGVSQSMAPIPSLLAISGLHHHLIRRKKRTRVSLIVESGEVREVHHFGLLLGYGCNAVNPYMAFETLRGLHDQKLLPAMGLKTAQRNYLKAIHAGIIKILSKMGISTMQSYIGAQIFEAVGLNKEVISKYFTGTASRIEGIGMEEIAREAAMKHEKAFNEAERGKGLEAGGFYKWRRDGEYHLYNPDTIFRLQRACRENDYQLYREYAWLIHEESQRVTTLRGMLEMKCNEEALPLEEVEPVERIVRRFKAGAMSYGSLSQEAHETIAIAMNRIGGKSNTGEGGEDPRRFQSDEKGNSSSSAIKQVASGRFGVTSEYLLHAREIQIKIAQGAKPGEGGQLPGKKVYPWIARVRYATPGIGLISPPPHHDIYSIEDLAQLIYDLRNANPRANISVKLVSEVGVGTVAAGVVKAGGNGVLISGYDGGTGASPRTSIQHAGLPWELGLAETHQTLLLNGLRDRIVLETDGKLMTGQDVAIAALLGAEEFGFATGIMVALGCLMMRVCHQDTCPVGIATQNPDLRRKFAGDPQHVVNFMQFIARDLREWMARMGFRTVDEMVGRMDKLQVKSTITNWKARNVDLSAMLYSPPLKGGKSLHSIKKQSGFSGYSLDQEILLKECMEAVQLQKKVKLSLPIKNTNRAVGTLLGSAVTAHHGGKGLPEDTIWLSFKGSAGQSFGAFVPAGITLELEGDANDFIGKGLSGGKIILRPPADSIFEASQNIIAGNVSFYGATSGEAYINGAAGERFCVRNSGVNAVVEAIGDHGCEYMTGGNVVILGAIGRNFAAGMSGGIAYVLDEKKTLEAKCNQELVAIEDLQQQEEERVKKMIERHYLYTGSKRAAQLLDQWNQLKLSLRRVIPVEYKRILKALDDRSEGNLNNVPMSSQKSIS